MLPSKSRALKLPNFFILGAAKCGTTSLYHYLNQHPDIYMPDIKEPTFFCQYFQVIKNPIDYFNLFEPAEAHRAIGEASGAYLTDPSTAKVMKSVFPEAKFIIILRNPADRAYSLYHHMRRNGLEHINTFEKALQQEHRRFNSDRFIKKCPQYYYNYLYFHSGLFGEQLERYFTFYERDHFYILTLDELKRNTSNILKEIFKFLDLEFEFKPSFEIYNKSLSTTRWPKLKYTLKKAQTFAPDQVSTIGKNLINKFVSQKVSSINSGTRLKLLDQYDADLKKLKQITGKDLY